MEAQAAKLDSIDRTYTRDINQTAICALVFSQPRIHPTGFATLSQGKADSYIGCAECQWSSRLISSSTSIYDGQGPVHIPFGGQSYVDERLDISSSVGPYRLPEYDIIMPDYPVHFSGRVMALIPDMWISSVWFTTQRQGLPGAHYV